jgi:hypothetical protein
MKNLFKIIILISVGLFLNSCYYDAFPEDIDGVDPPVIPDVVSYSEHIMPLWVGECIPCHNGGVAPDLRPENSYNSLLDGFVLEFNSEGSILYKSLIHADGVAPMPTLTELWADAKTDLVKAWIDQGAEDN